VSFIWSDDRYQEELINEIKRRRFISLNKQLNFYVFDIIEKVLFYSAILNAIQNHSSNRIETRNRRRRRRKRYSNSKNHRITIFEIHSASTCLVWRSYLESMSRNQSLKTFFILTYESIVAVFYLTLNFKRTIHNVSD
jgi:hypothetical protein